LGTYFNNPSQGMMIGATTSLIGGVSNAYSQYNQGQAMQSMHNTQARSLDIAADSEINNGLLQSTKFQRNINQFTANQKASMAANGVDSNSGTNTDVQTSTASQAELDRLTILYNANLKAWGLNQQAGQERIAGKNSTAAGATNATSTLIGSAGQFADIWNKWRMTSMGKNNTYTDSNDLYDPTTGQHGS
jgi:hypothetical protein